MNLVNMHNSIFFKPISFMKSGFLFFTFLIIIFVNPVLALDWSDDDWVQGGCPPDIFGTWVSNDVDQENIKTLKINHNRIRISNSLSLDEHYSFDKNDLVLGKKFIEINLTSGLNHNENSFYLKIRPHLIVLANNFDLMNSPTTSCFIKVFKFKSKENSKFGRYFDWEIYKLKK